MAGKDLHERLEYWVPIPGYEGLYSASNRGRIRSEDRTLYTKSGVRQVKGRVLSLVPMPDGYPAVTLCKDWKHTKRRVHVWVALAFHGPRPRGYEIRHKDGDKTNNAEHNIAYGASQENTIVS